VCEVGKKSAAQQTPTRPGNQNFFSLILLITKERKSRNDLFGKILPRICLLALHVIDKQRLLIPVIFPVDYTEAVPGTGNDVHARGVEALVHVRDLVVLAELLWVAAAWEVGLRFGDLV
jgi:hypothetical protein